MVGRVAGEPQLSVKTQRNIIDGLLFLLEGLAGGSVQAHWHQERVDGALADEGVSICSVFTVAIDVTRCTGETPTRHFAVPGFEFDPDIGAAGQRGGDGSAPRS